MSFEIDWPQVLRAACGVAGYVAFVGLLALIGAREAREDREWGKDGGSG